MNEVRFATVKKFASREMKSNGFKHAIFGWYIQSSDNRLVLKIATTPEKIVYFIDDVSYNKFVNKLKRIDKNIIDVCSVHEST